MKHLLLLWGVLFFSVAAHSQMLFSENLTTTIDSTKTLQSNLMPISDFKTEKADVFALKNTTNLNLLLNHNRVIDLVNKFESSTYGKISIVSGGYLHLEYHYLLDHAFEVYPYTESQQVESRGMNHKISMGLQSRYRLVNTKCSLMSAAVNLFFKYEKWQHPTPNADTPKHAYSRSIKTHLSLSYKLQLTEKWTLTTTGIYQTRPNSTFNKPRYGDVADLAYSITPTVDIASTYHLIYDIDPVVPARKDYNTMEVALNISFQFDNLFVRLILNQRIIIIFAVRIKHYLSTNI